MPPNARTFAILIEVEEGGPKVNFPLTFKWNKTS